MHTYIYLLTPLLAWLAAGILKFVINYIRFGKDAFVLIGNGGFPSTHTTVVTSAVMLAGFQTGFDTPAVGIGTALLLVTVVDALGLRRAVGRQAQRINVLSRPAALPLLRERQGHQPLEVFGGFVLGTFVAALLHLTVGTVTGNG